ncbi:MAG: hypothetical protein ABII06_07220 [Pseudomonadota bacterium]
MYRLRYHVLIIIMAHLFVMPLQAGAQNFVESFRQGKIDWSNGIAEAVGLRRPPEKSENPAQARAVAKSDAVHSARSNLLEVVGRVRIDSKTVVGDLLKRNESIRSKILDLLKKARVVDLSYHRDGSVHAAVAIELDENFKKLVLPGEIRHIEPIKSSQPLNGSGKEVYTGLVVDSRGSGIKCALVPRVLDEEGHVVYGPAYASRDYAVQKGMALYVADIKTAGVNPRVANRPLTVKGIRAAKEAQADIVISNADASKIRGSAGNLNFLQKCRVVIVLE